MSNGAAHFRTAVWALQHELGVGHGVGGSQSLLEVIQELLRQLVDRRRLAVVAGFEDDHAQ